MKPPVHNRRIDPDKLREMAAAGATDTECGLALGVTRESVRKYRRTHGIAPGVTARGGARLAPPAPPAWDRDRPRDPLSNARDGVMHLVDLKRAGHSPTRTELRIEACGHIASLASLQDSVRSLCGSPADMCSEAL